METALFIVTMLFGWLCSGALPLLLCVLACIDIARQGREWWWYPIVIVAPVLGPIAYFLVTRGPWSAVDSRGTDRQRRKLAEERLRNLNVQLGHWRGAGVLAEAGEELLALGRWAEAEAHFREAVQRGTPAVDVGLDLAETLAAQGRLAEAVAELQPVVAADPDRGLGRAQLLLASCLDRLDRGPEAEAALRASLERRNVPEARVRLARLLCVSGRIDEGRALASEVVEDARLLSPALRRSQASWTRAAKAILRGKLAPMAAAKGHAERARWPWIAALAVVGTIAAFMLIGAAGFAWYMHGALDANRASVEELRVVTRRLDALREGASGSAGASATTLVLTDADVTAYLEVRRAFAERLARPDPEPPPSGGLRGAVLEALDLGDPRVRERLPRELLALVEACERKGMDPESLPLHMEAIEWRFLHRRDAGVTALPPKIQDEVAQALSSLAVSGLTEASWRADRATSVQDLLSLAPHDETLAPGTLAVLEARRAELEALDERGSLGLWNAVFMARRVADRMRLLDEDY